jgi:hypothetical protein
VRERLVEALRRQRGQLKRLLSEAGVHRLDAEWLMWEALAEKSWEEWEGVRDTDKALLGCVDRACARYATSQGRAYEGLRALDGRPRAGGDRRAGGKKRRNRRP